jgi:hypothetical protein
VLARPRWRSLLLWQATEALLWVPRLLWYLGTDHRGVKVEWFLLGVVVRDLAVLTLMGLVVRDILQPDGDVVRTTWPGIDDPAGGVLDGAPDRVVLRGSAAEGVAEEDDLRRVRGGVARGLEDDRAVGGAGDVDE